MKALYIMLFVADSLLLMMLAYLLLKMLDEGVNIAGLLLMSIGIVACVGFLFIFIRQYVKTLQDDSN